MDERKIGIIGSQLQGEVEEINKRADEVQKNAEELVAAAKRIMEEGINTEWAQGTLTSLFNKLGENKVADAVADIKLQAKKLLEIQDVTTAYSNNNE